MRRVVVTAMGVVSPIGVGVTEFYRGLAEARSGIAEISSFDAASFPTRLAAEVPDTVSRDITCAGESQTALRRDRKSAFGVVAAREAIAAAFDSQPLSSYPSCRLGLSVAAGLEVFDVHDLAHYLGHHGFKGESFLADLLRCELHGLVSVPADTGARLIRRETGAGGPYCVNVSACAAGTQAIGEAFLSIREGAADAMLAGGYDSMINPLGLGGFCLLDAMTRRNDFGPKASRPFDVSRDGFVLGEGAAFFVLEELQHAVRRDAEILAEIEGYGSSLDAYRVTDPHPEGTGALSAMRQALSMAEIAPCDIDYVNAHGTGTPKNDPVESKALHALLGPEIQRVFVSSTKSQIGHLIGAAGAVEFAACLFALRKQMLPATISLERVDRQCRLRHVAGMPILARVHRILSNSFGFGGQNAAIVLTKYSDGTQ